MFFNSFCVCDESICSIRDSARRRQTCNASFRGRRATSPQRLASYKNKKTFSLLLSNFEQVIYCALNRQMIHSGLLKVLHKLTAPQYNFEDILDCF